MFQNDQPDQWWLNLDSVTEDEPMTIMQIEWRLKTGDYGEPFVMHVSKAGEENAAWIDLSLGEDARPKPPVSKPSPASSAFAATADNSTLGIILLIIPLLGASAAWFWVGGMNLLQDPMGSLNMVAFVVVAASAVLMAVEGNQLNMGGVDEKGKKRAGPLVWAVFAVLLWFIAFPAYMHERSKYGQRNMVIGGILVMLVFVGAYGFMFFVIEEQKASIRREMGW